MEDILFEIIEYTLPLEDAECIIWGIQESIGKDAAVEWMHQHFARFN